MAKFTPSRKSLKAPGGSKGGNSLMAYMIAQQKGQGLEQQLGDQSVATGGVDPSTGARFETKAGQDMDVMGNLRKKAADDALKLQQAIPILDDLEKSYDAAYNSYNGATAGIQGGIGAGKEYFTGILMRQNPELRNFLDKSGQYEAPLVKLTGDVGNFSASERSSASKGIPRVTPNTDISRLFLPDDVEFGKKKIQSLKQLYASKYQEAKQVADTGQLSGGYSDWLNANKSYTGGGAAQPENPSATVSTGRVRVRNKVDGKTGTVSLDKYDPNKYEKV